MKIKFIIDQEYDLQMIKHMLSGQDWEHRARRMGINLNFAKSIHQAEKGESPKINKLLKKLVEREYLKNLPFIQNTKDQYQKSWDEIINEFSKIISDLTYPWFYDEYICVVTHFNPGISNWNGNLIGRWWKENPYTQRRITAHEILLAHYFSIHRNQFPNSGLTDRQIWSLAEIASFALTGLEDKLKKFWPWDTRGYYTDHNYPDLVKLQEKLRDPFVNRKNFEEYVQKGIELIQNYPLKG